MCYISQPVVPPRWASCIGQCVLCEHIQLLSRYREAWTERGRDRNGALKLGELLCGSLTDAAVHINTHTGLLWAHSSSGSHQIRHSRKQKTPLLEHLFVCGCRFLISKPVWCVLILCAHCLQLMSSPSACVCVHRWSTASRCVNH